MVPLLEYLLDLTRDGGHDQFALITGEYEVLGDKTPHARHFMHLNKRRAVHRKKGSTA